MGATDDREEELRRLVRALRRSSGFRFYTVAVDDPRGAASLLDALAAAGCPLHRLGFPHSTRLDLDAHREPLAERLIAPLLEPARAPPGVDPLALDLSNAVTRDEAVWQWFFERLNERRNRISAALDRPLVLLATPATLRWFTASAPDLWSVVSGHFECATAPEDVAPAPSPTLPSSPRAVEAALREAATLEASGGVDAWARAFALRAAVSEAMAGDPTLREAALRCGVAAADGALRAGQSARALELMERAAALAADAAGPARAEAWRSLAALHDRRGDATRAARFRARADAAGPRAAEAPAPEASERASEAPAPNGPFRRAEYVDRPALERSASDRLLGQRQPTAIVGAHGCGKSWLLDRVLDGRVAPGRRVHLDLGALPRAPDAFLTSLGAALADARRERSPQEPGEFLDEWVQRLLTDDLRGGDLVLTLDVDVDLLTTPQWHRLEGLLRGWSDRRSEAPWGNLLVAVCASGEDGAVREAMRSSGFESPTLVGALEAAALDELVPRFGLRRDDEGVRAVLEATGGDAGPLVACLHAMARRGLAASDALDPARNPALDAALGPFRRWLADPRRRQVLRGIAARPGVQLQGDARLVAGKLAVAGLVTYRGGWRLRRGVYAALAPPEATP